MKFYSTDKQDSSSLAVLLIAFNAVFTLSRLSFYGQLLEQLIVALLSHPTVCLLCYALLLLYSGQIIDDDGDDALLSRPTVCLLCYALLLLYSGQIIDDDGDDALLSRPTVCLLCYALLLLYSGQIIDDDDDGDDIICHVVCSGVEVCEYEHHRRS